MKFSKELSPSEAKYKYIGLSKDFRTKLPEKDELFDIKFKGKIYTSKVNNKDCIMLTQFYHAHEFQAGNTVTFNTDKKIVELTVE